MSLRLPSAEQLKCFVRESNAIEGIDRWTEREVYATKKFIELKRVEIIDLMVLVDVYQPEARLRDQAGLDVRVGDHIPPPGGPTISTALRMLLLQAPFGDPWNTHVAYEALHPFTDGNGRSGRALWAWQMVRRSEGLSLGFLRRFYYQTLSGIPRAGDAP